jgi:hypothetical protein
MRYIYCSPSSKSSPSCLSALLAVLDAGPGGPGEGDLASTGIGEGEREATFNVDSMVWTIIVFKPVNSSAYNISKRDWDRVSGPDGILCNLGAREVTPIEGIAGPSLHKATCEASE